MALATGRPATRPDDAGLAPALADGKARSTHPARIARAAAEPPTGVVSASPAAMSHDAVEPATEPSKILALPSIGTMTVDEHFTALGGYDGAVALTGEIVTAFRLWDSHRLWLRDFGRDQRDRWDAQYRETWSRICAKPDLRPE